MASVALLVPLRAVLAGLMGPLKDLSLTSVPGEPMEEALKSFWRSFMPSDEDAWLLRLSIEAEAQREERGRKIETRVRTWEEMPGVLTK